MFRILGSIVALASRLGRIGYTGTHGNAGFLHRRQADRENVSPKGYAVDGCSNRNGLGTPFLASLHPTLDISRSLEWSRSCQVIQIRKHDPGHYYGEPNQECHLPYQVAAQADEARADT